MRYFIYTDASFSHREALAVSGFLVFGGEEAHEKSLISGIGIRTQVFAEANNIRAEIIGAIHALKVFNTEIKKEKQPPENFEVHLYSDCQTLTKLLERREKLTLTDFISGRKKTLLANADLYKEFFSVFDEIKPVLHWVKGHSEKQNQSLFQKHFQLVDKRVRKELRLALAEANRAVNIKS